MKNRKIEHMLRDCRDFCPKDSVRERVLREAGLKCKKKRVNLVGFPFKRIIAVAASLIFVSIALLFITGYTAEFETVYIDVNPSVELTLNKYERIIDINYLNSDAEESLSELPLKNKKVTDGIDLIMTCLDGEGYFEEGEINIGVIRRDGKDASEMLGKLNKAVEGYKKNNGSNVTVKGSQVTPEEKEAAKDSGLSPVKYKLIQSIIELDDSYNTEMLSSYSMKDLRDLYNSLNPDDKGKPNK